MYGRSPQRRGGRSTDYTDGHRLMTAKESVQIPHPKQNLWNLRNLWMKTSPLSSSFL